SIKKLLFLFLSISISLTAQDKITLEQIWGGAFRTEQMQELQSMNNSNEYTILNYDRSSRVFSIDLYDFATLEKKSTLFSTRDFSELKSIDSYSFDTSEKKILIASNSEYIYRRSFTADFFVYDIQTKKLQKVTDKKIQEPLFTPNGKSVVYAFENNLYLYDLDTKSETPITTDGKRNQII